MVFLDKLSDVLDELADIITAGLPTLNLVSRRPLNSGQLSADDYPAIDIDEGPSSDDNELTSTVDQVVSVVIRIYTKGDPEGKEGSDLKDLLVSLIRSNATLNDTCISAIGQGSDRPRNHLGTLTSSHRDYQLLITYRRDIE